MIARWFGKKKAAAEQRRVQELETRLQDVTLMLSRMEQTLSRMADQPPRITIEAVHIHQPVLERMEYRLDRLDIQTLSGALNLGNNFGAKTKPDVSADRPSSPASMPSPDGDMGLQRTATGFRMTKP